jgi:hypothetical protein
VLYMFQEITETGSRSGYSKYTLLNFGESPNSNSRVISKNFKKHKDHKNIHSSYFDLVCVGLYESGS